MKKTVTLVLLMVVSAFSLSVAKESANVYRATADPDGVQRVEIVAGSYYFKPDHIVVKVNQPVQLKVRKEGGLTPHNIVLKAPEAGIDFEVPLAEEPKSISFVPTKSGSYQFYCNKKLLFFARHREKGMHGILEVEE